MPDVTDGWAGGAFESPFDRGEPYSPIHDEREKARWNAEMVIRYQVLLEKARRENRRFVEENRRLRAQIGALKKGEIKMENIGTLYEKLSETVNLGPMASLGDAEITENNYQDHAERIAAMAGEELTAAGREGPTTTEWREYLAATDVKDDRTPRERLAEYFA